ncbi:MAG TPA: universal stress protein [Noviherbaspirillum sp.]|uniref:universal stress protein n=1 Tax=Noviherbaspirillum sp. TaxID=1926288 RepID=UPI002B46CD51|nr:universal stress protein [Noviherbaspirillum sp.]HJV85057.1 universal stress protein [Noviherbaspirillum sp.]
MRVLVAVDGSKYSRKAVKHVASHLDWFQGKPELHLLHVKEPVPAGRSRPFLAADLIADYYRKESEITLSPAGKLLDKLQIPYTAAWRVGDVAEEIRAYARKHKIDMIVMGSHGRTAFQNLVMGSVATKVIAATNVPILIVR